MTKKKKKASKSVRKPRFQKIKSFFASRQTQTIFGSFTTLFAIFLLFSMLSYFVNWQQDQSELADLSNGDSSIKNSLGKVGASMSDF